MANQEQLAAAVSEASAEALRTRDQLQTAVDSLNQLVRQKSGDLRPAYDDFGAQVAGTRAAAETTARRADSMRSRAEQYFGGWQGEIERISNPKIRKTAEKRLASSRKSYDSVLASLDSASESFKPLLSDLGDIQTALSNDLTAGGLKAIKPIVREANSYFRKVNESINNSIRQFGKLQTSLAPVIVP